MLKVALAGLALAVLVVGGAYFGQRRLMYFPDRARTPPASIGLTTVQEIVLAAPDGAKLIHWWGKAKAGKATILYFHGNGGALADRAPRFERFMGEGWGVLMMSYRGYGGSDGSPTEVDNVADALRAYDYLVAQGVGALDIVLYGESLGTGVAAQVATQRPASGLILEAPYTSTVAVGALQYPFLPIAAAMKDRYETDKHIVNVRIPLLVLHGSKDAIIPVSMGQALLRLANEPKHMVEFPDGGHSDLYVNRNVALAVVRRWLAAVRGVPQTPG